MSEAPSAIASSITFWMNLTTGASSTSLAAGVVGRGCALVVAELDRQVLVDELLQRGVAARARAVEDRASLSSSTTIGSIDEAGLELDLVEDLAVGGIGDRDASRLPRLRSGSTRRVAISFRSTS